MLEIPSPSCLSLLKQKQNKKHDSNGSDKLTKLSKQQCNELATDVFDEMKRRTSPKVVRS